MATTLLDSPNLREALAATRANLRGMPPAAPGFMQQAQGVFAPGSFGAQNYAANTPAPVAPVPAAAPALAPAPVAGNVFAPPGQSPVPLQAAGGLVQTGQAGEMARYQDALRVAGVNLDPFGQAPGDFAQAQQSAVGIYNKTFGAPATPGVAPAPGGPTQSFAPTGLRAQAIAAGGAPVTGFGGAQVTAQPNAAGGTGFNLTQNPNTVPGAPGYVPPQAPAPAAATPAAKAPTAFDQNAAAYKAQQPGSAFTAPDGSMFSRDAHGRLQAVGTNPDLAAKAEGLKAGAVEEAKKTAEDAHKLLGEVSDSAETSRVQSGAIKRITDLYAQGATSGFAQPLLTQAAAALARVTGKEVKVANQQQLEKEMGNLMLESSRSLMKGGGSVSNFERELVMKATANQSLTPQANMQILGVLGKIGERNQALEKERIRLDELGVPSAQIAKELRQMRDTMPVGVENLHSLVPAGESQTVGKYKVVLH